MSIVSDDMSTLEMPVARVFYPLLSPARFKGARGGRGSGKTHFVAEQIIQDCMQEHHRVACLREFQNSVKESNKQMIEGKIRQFGLEDLFHPFETEIRGPNESVIMFRGLDGKSADSLKSITGITRAWVEEAQRVSKRSLDMMTPTFRSEPGMPTPEMYFTWNPISADDPVEKLFSDAPAGDPDFICVTSNYVDNPWFPADLRRDMERTRIREPDKYAHVWLGEYQRTSEARVFRNWKIEEFDEPPPRTRFYFGSDWGFSIDPSVLVRCWIDEVHRRLYVDYEAYQVGCEIDELPRLFDKVPGSRRWRIRADSARPETISYLKTRHGYDIVAAEKGAGSVEDGIEFLRSYDIIVHPRCRHTSDELSKYAYKTDRRTEEVMPILEDKNNHVIDSLRYALEGARKSMGWNITGQTLEAARRGAGAPAPRVQRVLVGADGTPAAGDGASPVMAGVGLYASAAAQMRARGRRGY